MPAGAGAVVQAKKKGSSPVTLFALIAVVAGGGYFLLSDDGSDDEAPRPKDAPELWDRRSRSVRSKVRRRSRSRAIDSSSRTRNESVAHSTCKMACSACRSTSKPLRAFAPEVIRRRPPLPMRPRSDCGSTSTTIPDPARSARARAQRGRLERCGPSSSNPSSVHGRQTGDYVLWLNNLERKLKTEIGKEPGT